MWNFGSKVPNSSSCSLNLSRFLEWGLELVFQTMTTPQRSIEDVIVDIVKMIALSSHYTR
jgi:hypothetical protein